MKQPQFAKLTRPRVERLLKRERLFTALDERSKRPLVWVSAPPGAGKTSLVASYLESRKRPNLWYQLDEADTDPATFFFFLREAANGLRLGNKRTLPVLAEEAQVDLPGFARLYFRALFSRFRPGSVLVLDNYQDVSEVSPLHVALAVAVEEIPPSLCVIALSRRAPHAAFGQLRGSQRIAEIDWSQIKFTLEETTLVACEDQVLPEQTVHTLFEHTQGWAAGLTLMLERLKLTGQLKNPVGSENLETVFDYFAGLMLNAAGESVRDALVRMSYLPRLTAESAGAISGNPDAESMLADIAKRNLFVERRFGVTTSYQFHTLFRRFLQSYARRTLGASEHVQLANSAAALLAGMGQVEDAFPLYLETRSWDSAARLACKEAQRLIGEGRRQTLRDWITALPMQNVERDPWLRYWLAAAVLMQDRRAARQQLEEAYKQFVTERAADGLLACASLAIDSYFAEDWIGVEVWMDRLRDALRIGEESEPGMACSSALQSLARAMCFHNPADPRLPGIAERVRRSLSAEQTAEDRVRAVGTLVFYHWIQGDATACDLVYRRLPSSWIEEDTPVADRLFCAYFAICHLDACGLLEEAATLLARADKLTDESGLAPLNVEFKYLAAIPLIRDGHLATAKRLLVEKVRPYVSTARPMARAWYHGFLATCAHRQGYTTDAMRELRVTVNQYLEHGNAAGRSMIEPHCAFLLMEGGHIEEGLRIAQALRTRLPQNQRAELVYLVAQAYAQVRNEHDSEVHQTLCLLVPLLFRCGYCWFPWESSILPIVLSEALKRNIRSDSVSAYIKKFRLRCPNLQLLSWPWPVRISVLGSFQVETEHTANATGRKAQHKLLNLLWVISASRKNGIVAHELVDILWPDAEGDKGHNVLQVSIHRLRQWLGLEQAIEVRDGRLMLNSQLCWVDAWAFEASAEQALGMNSHDPGFENTALRALDLYRGHLLSREQNWLPPAREKLRHLWLSLVKKLGEDHERRVDWSSAIALYERAVSIDPTLEELYRRLLVCLRATGEQAAAANIYYRCKEQLSAAFGASPSAETTRLYESIVGADRTTTRL